MVFCKLITCDWNRWDEQHQKHVCNKLIVQLNTDGECDLASHMHTSIHKQNTEIMDVFLGKDKNEQNR